MSDAELNLDSAAVAAIVAKAVAADMAMQPVPAPNMPPPTNPFDAAAAEVMAWAATVDAACVAAIKQHAMELAATAGIRVEDLEAMNAANTSALGEL